MKIITGIAIGVVITLILDGGLLLVWGQNSFWSLVGAFGGGMVGGFIARERSWAVGLAVGIVGDATATIILAMVGYGVGLKGGLLMGLAVYVIGVESALMAITTALIGSTLGARIYKARRAG